MNIEKDSPTFEYVLIDYAAYPASSKYKHVQVIMMTEHEAHCRNKGFALNGTTNRYIKGS
jgi:hypothetical protein